MRSVSAQSDSLKRKLTWLALLALPVLALAMVVVPVLTIQPFKPQTAESMNLSYMLRHWSPLVSLAFLIIALLLVLRLWRGTRRWWRKALLVVALVPVLAAAWFSRQNYFEWMFAPLPQAAYTAGDKADFVADDEMVLAVELNGEAVAYPVRQMAYHHVVGDVVGGTPVVATY